MNIQNREHRKAIAARYMDKKLCNIPLSERRRIKREWTEIRKALVRNRTINNGD